MKLLTKELLKKFKKIGKQELEDPIVICIYFHSFYTATWYATEYDSESEIFFGYVSLFGDGRGSWGNFSLDELKSIRWKGIPEIGVERNLYFKGKKFSKLNI